MLICGFCNAIPALAEVSVAGLNDDAERNVELSLSLHNEDCKSPEWKIRSLFAAADVAILLGDRVSFSGLGLTAKLAGRLQLRKSADATKLNG